MTPIFFTPWRYAYLSAGPNGGCIFCSALRQKDPQKALLLWQTPHTLVMLNRYPYMNGHTMIAPKEHIGSFEDLSPQVCFEMMEEAQKLTKILREVYACHGFNIGMNVGAAAGAGIEDHLHCHVVPRWKGDHNFMRVLNDLRLIPEDLRTTYEKLQKAYQNLTR